MGTLWYPDFQDKQRSSEEKQCCDGKDQAIPESNRRMESNQVDDEAAHGWCKESR